MGTKTKISIVKRRPVVDENKICEIISKGGKTTQESKDDKAKEIRFSIRVPKYWVDKMDISRKKRAGFISRNQWVIEAMHHYIDTK